MKSQAQVRLQYYSSLVIKQHFQSPEMLINCDSSETSDILTTHNSQISKPDNKFSGYKKSTSSLQCSPKLFFF